jgi:hypothetical protein
MYGAARVGRGVVRGALLASRARPAERVDARFFVIDFVIDFVINFFGARFDPTIFVASSRFVAVLFAMRFLPMSRSTTLDDWPAIGPLAPTHVGGA